MHTKTSHAFYKKVVFNASGNSIVSKMLFVYCAVGVLFGRREWLKCTKEQALPDL